MLRGLYTAASGMNAETVEQDVVANNLANVNTVGFKKDSALLEAFPQRLLVRIHDRLDRPGVGPDLPAVVADQLVRPVPIGMLGQGVETVGTATQFIEGPLSRTAQPLDLALQGPGLFTVRRGDGTLAYTRAGDFTLNSAQQLCTKDGDLVMGADLQPLRLAGPGMGVPHVVIDAGGQVKVDGEEVGDLKLVDYDAAHFEKVGENLYTRRDDAFEGIAASEQSEPADVRVLQGYLEQSNVQVVTEMVHMISLMRTYEENTKAITMQDETLSQLITSVGTPSA